MRSFTFVLIAATLATLGCAAPVELPGSSSVVPAELPGVSSPSLGSIAGGVHRRDTPSVAVIFSEISTDIQAYVEQLKYLTSTNCTLNEVTSIVGSIKTPIINAIPELKALVGLDASIILGPIQGDVELTVSEVATIVGGEVELILAAAGNVLQVVQTEGGDIVGDVEGTLNDLGCTVTDLVGDVLALVDGLAAALLPILSPVDSVISGLQLTQLSSFLGLDL